MTPTRRTVTKPFRELLATTYPKLGSNYGYWSFLGYLLFGTFTDKRSSKLVISSEIIADCEKKNEQWQSRNYHSGVFLEAFAKEVQVFTWSNWNSGKNGEWQNGNKLARIVTDIKWPKTILDAIQRNVHVPKTDSERVYLADGQLFTRKRQLQFIEEDKVYSLKQLTKAQCQEAKVLLDYMNKLPSNRFYKQALKYISEALQASQALPDSPRQQSILLAMSDQPQQFYQPTKASTRIFGMNEGLQYLHRDLRKIVTRGWVESDLKSAQLAIAAATWNLPLIKKFLSNNGSIWQHLFDQYKVEPDDIIKGIFKNCLYALMYGETKKDVKAMLHPLKAKPFLDSQLIQELWQERTQQLKKIENKSGATNCFGQFLSLKQFSKRSILAQLAQAYELKLLYPVIELARSHTKEEGFTILLWQHDGFSWIPNKKANERSWARKLYEVVKKQANDLGIVTHLEFSGEEP